MIKLASRLSGPYKAEKCPVCLEIGGAVPFYEVELGGVPVLVCAKVGCRCLWVPSYVDLRGMVEVRPELINTIVPPDLLETAREMVADLACKVCGKECKSSLGLGSHMRSHA